MFEIYSSHCLKHVVTNGNSARREAKVLIPVFGGKGL
jgi:hypothetical protein